MKEKNIKTAAKRIGISTEEYKSNLANGLKRCYSCKTWKPIARFHTDKNRWDGLFPKCRDCTRVKESKPNLGSRMRGKRHSPETKQRMAEARKGAGNSNWKGGITPEYRRARQCKQYYEWRQKVFERDGYLCQNCKDGKKRELRAHHIKPFKDHPELRYEVSNGLTLCVGCHNATHY